MPQLQFFLTPADARCLLKRVESRAALQYVRTGNSVSPDFDRFETGLLLPDLGIANCETGSGCRGYLVAQRNAALHVRRLIGRSGEERFCMDQLMNEDTVAFTPAGLWGETVLLQGSVGSASNSAVSAEILKCFRYALRKHTKRVQCRYVGEEALMLLRGGARLTLAVQSPAEFDLVSPASGF